MNRFIERLRELLLPTLALTILATLWVLAKARNGEEDLARGLATPPPLALVEKARMAAADADLDDKPEQSTAHADTTSADHR